MKNSFRTISLVILCALSIFLTNCTDPLEVGANLLDEDRAQVGFTDTLTLKARTVRGDTVRAFSPGVGAISNFLFGRTENPYFGITEAAFYIEPLLLRDLGGIPVEFATDPTMAFIDSVVLVLPLDSSGIYGRVNGNFGIEVYEVMEAITPQEDEDGAVSFYSNASFATLPTPLASTSFRPNYVDSVFVKKEISFATLDTVDLRVPHVRVRLDDSFGQRFIRNDTSVYVSDSTLLDHFKGLYVKPTGVAPGIIDFDLNRSWPGIYFYYRLRGDTLVYNLELGSIGRRVSQYNHIYDGYAVGDVLDTPNTPDSLLFLQGLQGLMVAFEVPGLADFSNKVINKAELELKVAVPDDYDIAANPVVDQIIALRKNDDGQFVAINDVSILPNDLGLYFGGQPEEQEDGSLLYTLNLSIHTQYLIDGSEPATVYLAVLPRPGNASQVILRGPASLEHPPVLKVSFTDL